MKRLALLVLMACGTSPGPLQLTGVGERAAEPKLEANAADFTFANLRRDGELWAVDVTGRFDGAYGLALRLNLQHAKLTRAAPAQSWPIARFEPTASGAVAVLSEQGAASGRTSTGTIATLWLQLDGPGAISFDSAHSGALRPDGTSLPVTWGSAAWR